MIAYFGSGLRQFGRTDSRNSQVRVTRSSDSMFAELSSLETSFAALAPLTITMHVGGDVGVTHRMVV